MTGPSLLSTPEVAKRLGVHSATACRWSRTEPYAGCIVRRTRTTTWWSVARMEKAGLLKPEAAAQL